MTPDHWRFVRLSHRKADRFDLLTFWSHMQIDEATKTLLGLNHSTQDLSYDDARFIGQLFEDAFAKADQERYAGRGRKVRFPVT